MKNNYIVNLKLKLRKTSSLNNKNKPWNYIIRKLTYQKVLDNFYYIVSYCYRDRRIGIIFFSNNILVVALTRPKKCRIFRNSVVFELSLYMIGFSHLFRLYCKYRLWVCVPGGKRSARKMKMGRKVMIQNIFIQS